MRRIRPRTTSLHGSSIFPTKFSLCAPLAVQASKSVARDSAACPDLREAREATYDAARRTPEWSGR